MTVHQDKVESFLTVDQSRKVLHDMGRSREADRREAIMIRQGRAWFHASSQGHEALAALALVLKDDDWIFPHYRDRALLLGRGMPLRGFADNFLGKPSSSSGGRQLPSHYSSHAHRVWSMPSPVGSNLLPAAGAAWAAQLRGESTVTLACVGDGGMRQGEFYEAWSFAVERRLPLILVVEDNRYGISTPTEAGNPLRTGVLGHDRVLRVNGRDPHLVYQAGFEAVSRAREGDGPTLLWCDLDRLSSHSSTDDQRLYRTAEALAEQEARDPLKLWSFRGLAAGWWTQSELDEWHQQWEKEVEEAYLASEASPNPSRNDSAEHWMPEPGRPAIDLIKTTGEARLLDLVNLTLRTFLERDSRIVLFGEDIEDPLGGVFKMTVGLSRDFPARVFNSPLAEGTIVGTGCGLASVGMRPVFELQFIDFSGPAWNQIVTNLSTLRWRSNGEWTCPMIVYAPSGAYLPAGGPWHSQSLESALAQLPGIRVVVPSTPEDAAGFFLAAYGCDDPTFILLPKHLLRVRRSVPREVRPLPFGRAIIRREGSEVTIVAWGNTVELALAAAAKLEDRVSVEVIDLRSISPWDRETVGDSVRRTGRLLVVQEENRSCSMGESVIAEVASREDLRQSLLRSPVLLARESTHVGFHPEIESACLPSCEDICQKVLELIGLLPDKHEGILDRKANREKKGAADVNQGKVRVPVVVPMIGEGLEEARVLKFFKRPGDSVHKDEHLYQLETDKAVVDVESSHDAVVGEWNVQEDSVVPIGAEIGELWVNSVVASPEGQHAVAERPVVQPMQHGVPVQTHATIDTQLYPAVEAPLSPRQQRLAERLARAARTAVPATIFSMADWEPVKSVRRAASNRPDAASVTSFSLAAWCVAQAMARHEVFRSSLTQENRVRTYAGVHLGVAVSLPEDELALAVVENAADLSPIEFSKRLRDRVERVRNGEDMSRVPATLLLTSLAALEVRQGIPVIVPPAVATLLLGSPAPKVTLQNGNPVEHDYVQLALTIDHRVINGAGAASFLKEVKEQLERLSVDGL